MGKKKSCYILLISHKGVPTEWPVAQATLGETFERLKNMCAYELSMGGSLKMLDADRKVIEEVRGPQVV